MGLPQRSQREHILPVTSRKADRKKVGFIGPCLLRVWLLQGGEKKREPANIFVFVCHADVNAYDLVSNCLGARPDVISFNLLGYFQFSSVCFQHG